MLKISQAFGQDAMQHKYVDNEVYLGDNAVMVNTHSLRCVLKLYFFQGLTGRCLPPLECDAI